MGSQTIVLPVLSFYYPMPVSTNMESTDNGFKNLLRKANKAYYIYLALFSFQRSIDLILIS